MLKELSQVLLNSQLQPPTVLYKKVFLFCFFYDIYRKTLVLEFLFNKVVNYLLNTYFVEHLWSAVTHLNVTGYTFTGGG